MPYSHKVGRLSGVWHWPILTSECVPASAADHEPSVIAGRSAKSASALSNILDKRLIFIHDDVNCRSVATTARSSDSFRDLWHIISGAWGA